MTLAGEIKPWTRRLLALPHAHDRLPREELVPKATESGGAAGIRSRWLPAGLGKLDYHPAARKSQERRRGDECLPPSFPAPQ